MLDDSAAEGCCRWFSQGFLREQAFPCRVFAFTFAFAFTRRCDRFHYPRYIDSRRRLYDNECRWIIWCRCKTSKRGRKKTDNTRRNNSIFLSARIGGGRGCQPSKLSDISISPYGSVICTSRGCHSTAMDLHSTAMGFHSTAMALPLTRKGQIDQVDHDLDHLDHNLPL